MQCLRLRTFYGTCPNELQPQFPLVKCLIPFGHRLLRQMPYETQAPMLAEYYAGMTIGILGGGAPNLPCRKRQTTDHRF